ncbi:MAG: hypothetical protein ACP5FH_04040 [Terracidiphilus sp.]
MNSRILAFAAASFVASCPVFAQQSQPSPAQPGPVSVRRNDQQQRIANGVQSGQLTAGETKNLESREAGLNREVRADRAASGGTLTAQQQQQIHRQQNNLSRSIYIDKHNAAQAHYGNNPVGQRRANQQNRIANGIRNGSMTAGEAARTETREQGINQRIHADRAANGGRLTPGERQQINRQKNRASRQIYRQKHNRWRR